MSQYKNSCANSTCTELDPCIFPVLDDDSNGRDEDFQKISVGCLPNLSEHQEIDGRGIHSFTIIGWSIVLRRFTEMDCVHFGVHGLPSGDMDKSKRAQQSRICKVFVDPEASTKNLTKDGYTLELPSPTCHSHLNTGIFFIDGDDKLEDGIVAGVQSGCRDHRYDIMIIVREYDSRSEVFVYYRASAMADVHARSLAGTVKQVNQWMLHNPNQRPREAELCCLEDLQQIAQWNNRPVAEPVDDLIDTLIEKHGLSNPASMAVCSWDGNLTYVQLSDFSARLAAHLQSLGIGPGSKVPLCMDKSRWAMVAVLAVIKTGAAFVPLEGSQPVKRLQDIITQVNADIVLASPTHAANLANVANTIVSVSEDDVTQLPQADLAPCPHTPDDLAYILFTSGSTGSPKGCMMNHRELAGFAAYSEPLQISDSSRSLHFASYGVHASLVETFCTLAAGAALCIPSDHDRMNDLDGAINRMGVTWAILTPSTLKSLNTRALTSLKTVITGAEPIPKDPFRVFEGSFQLRISYGMTECAGILSSQADGTMDEKNIGSPFYGNFWLTEPDNHNRLAPIVAVAELVVEGPYLAHGYFKDPEKTAATFVDNPLWLQHFRTDTNRRAQMYKTGDLGQYASDGTIRYLGRKDTQVKLRGLRIELGEVEYHLQRSFYSADIISADVISPIDGSYAPSLIAFIWSKPNSTTEKTAASAAFPLFAATDEQFREDAAAASLDMRASLPGHMVPSVYIPLAHLPMTISRKVDRKALRAQAAMLDREHLLLYSNGECDKAQAETDMERTLHRLFAQILDLEPTRIGIHDSFFRVGGDSIASMQLVTLCRAEDIALTVQDIFENDTISDLAAYLTGDRLESSV